MNDLKKKKLIQIIIVLFCFGGTGFILYNGFFKYQNAPVANMASPGIGIASKQGQLVSKKIETILPNGSELDFGSLNRPSVQYGTTLYENKVSTSEIGMLEYDLISVKILENSSTP